MVIRKIPQEQNKYASLKIFPLLWLTSMVSAYFVTSKDFSQDNNALLYPISENKVEEDMILSGEIGQNSEL